MIAAKIAVNDSLAPSRVSFFFTIWNKCAISTTFLELPSLQLLADTISRNPFSNRTFEKIGEARIVSNRVQVAGSTLMLGIHADLYLFACSSDSNASSRSPVIAASDANA
jgi:hypothetical protein